MKHELLADSSDELTVGGQRSEPTGDTTSEEGEDGRSETSGDAEETREGGARESGGAGRARNSSLWAAYKRSMHERPLLTKSFTAAAVSALGEVVGSALRRPSPPPSLPMGAGAALVVKGRRGVTAAAATPGLLRRTAAFAFFGFVMNGPVFHWWYGALERASARLRKTGDPPGGAGDIAFKLAMDRFLITPPYLAFTLASLRLLQGLGVSRSVRETRALYRGVLLMNWKVWTIAQLINFKVIPVEFRPVFGNFVACWWNIYLSLLPAQK